MRDAGTCLRYFVLIATSATKLTQRRAALEPLPIITSWSRKTCRVCGRPSVAKGRSVARGTSKHLLPWHGVCAMVDQLLLILCHVSDILLPYIVEIGFCKCLDHGLEIS